MQKWYQPEVEPILRNYNPTAAAIKHRVKLLRVARKVKEPTVYRCPTCDGIIKAHRPQRWCPLCNGWMGKRGDKVVAGWRER